MCILYNQRDANYTIFFYYYQLSTCFGRFFRPSSGAYKTVCSLGYCHAFLLSTAGGVDGLEPIHTSVRNMYSADNNKAHFISCISLVI